MNTSYIDILVYERCADIRREIAFICLLRQTKTNPGTFGQWFDRQMLSLGMRMISVGERVCRRYSAPAIFPNWRQAKAMHDEL